MPHGTQCGWNILNGKFWMEHIGWNISDGTYQMEYIGWNISDGTYRNDNFLCDTARVRIHCYSDIYSVSE